MDSAALKSFAVSLATHLDRVRRRSAPMRDGVVACEIAGGWLAAQPGREQGEVPSACQNRMYFLTGEELVREGDVELGLQEAKRLGCSRVFVYLAPWKVDAAVEA